MAGGGLAAVAIIGVGLLLAFGLYVVVRAEHDRRETMDRDRAERVARRDEDDESG